MNPEPHEKPIIPVLAAIIRDERGQVLIARRKSHLSNGGKWEFPGGKLFPGESPEQCLQREIREEMGIEIEVLGPFQLVNFSYPEKSILLIGYNCRFAGGDWHLTDHDQIRWVEKPRLGEYNFSAADLPIVEKLQTADSWVP